MTGPRKHEDIAFGRESKLCRSLVFVVWVPLVAALSCDATAGPAGETIDQLMEHVSVSYETPEHVTWYTPKFGERPKGTVFATLGVSDDGTRRMDLSIFAPLSVVLRAERMSILVDDESREIQIDRSEHLLRVIPSASGLMGTIMLEDQEILIRLIAGASHVSVTIVEHQWKPWEMSVLREDLDSYRRIVTLHDLATLPADEIGATTTPELIGHYFAGYGGITNPQLVPQSKAIPKYPERGRQAKVEGQVILFCLVSKDGSVGDFHVVKAPSGEYGFEEAAIKAVRKWRYKPALMDGKPVDAYFTVIVDFFLGRGHSG